MPAELLHSPFELVMTLLHQVRGEQWEGNGGARRLPLPQPVADLLNELRRFEWVELPAAVYETLRRFDKPALLTVCVRSIELLYGIVKPQRERHRASRQRKRRRWAAQRRQAAAT